MKVHHFNKNYKSPLKMITPLVKICSILAINPPYVFGVKSKPCSKSFKIYSVAMLTILLGGYFYHLYDHVVAFMITVTNMMTVLVVNLWNGERFKTLLCHLETFDVSIHLRVRNQKNKFWMGFILCHLAIIFAITVDFVAWINSLGIKLYKYYIPRNIQYYHFNVALFLTIWLAFEMRRRFKKVNDLLWQSVKGSDKTSRFPRRIKLNDTPLLVEVANYDLLKHIKVWHADLSKAVNNFNSLFGTIFLCGVLFNIAIVVHYTQTVIVYVVFQNNGTCRFVLIINSIVWISVAMLQTILIAAACDGLTKEANKLPVICYVLLSDLHSVPQTECDRILREELLLLAALASSRKIRVSAAGFFDVDLGMMGFIVASITSYIIVTIQFVADN